LGLAVGIRYFFGHSGSGSSLHDHPRAPVLFARNVVCDLSASVLDHFHNTIVSRRINMDAINRRSAIKLAIGSVAAAGLVSGTASTASAAVVAGKVRNSTGTQVTFGLFGKSDSASFRASLAPGQIISQSFITGDRVIVVWDDFTDAIIYSDITTIDQSHKKIDLKSASAVVTRNVIVVNDDNAY
jgi:hypothetical protein